MLSNLNSIILEGNLVADPVAKTTPNGTSIASFSIASNRTYFVKEKEVDTEVSYFDIEAWSKLADSCNETLKKGRSVRVVGRLKQDRWTDADWKNHSRVKIVAEHVEFKPMRKKAPAEVLAEQS